MSSGTGKAEIDQLVTQLSLDLGFLFHEIKWALGEERINRVPLLMTNFGRGYDKKMACSSFGSMQMRNWLQD